MILINFLQIIDIVIKLYRKLKQKDEEFQKKRMNDYYDEKNRIRIVSIGHVTLYLLFSICGSQHENF